ncbi:hypothetical protein FB567DRAFT_554555 [Paraphoma chrysanthemicola]|uniref:Protein kinase domain-containing protein n=1 Tax=Paraphoma chrysanthemicola TaxID=798071 RepID=A0A8K0QW37_9PLEO|nr:hypothetical protein FB567DRAFT_554555 [Paraphoma chrysanthemicola]
MTKDEAAAAEVAHLTRTNHAHIVFVIGIYVKGREFSILVYPVADYSLDAFLEAVEAGPKESLSRSIEKPGSPWLLFLSQQCLARYSSMPHEAHEHQDPEYSETDGLTSFSQRYAAPEVAEQDMRGLPTDISVLGCVFLEMLCAMSDYMNYSTAPIEKLLGANAQGNKSYRANLFVLQAWLGEQYTLLNQFRLRATFNMLKECPGDRPTAEELVKYFSEKLCCVTGSEELEATKE